MKKASSVLLSILALLLAGCSYEEMSKRLVPEKEAEYARKFLDRLRLKDLEYVLEHTHPDVREEATQEKILEVAEYFRAGEPISVELIGSQTNQFNSNWRGAFTFEYQFEDGWVVANAVLVRADGESGFIGFHVYQTEASQREIHAFTLKGKSLLQIIVLIAAIAVPIFIVVSLVFCIRTPVPKRKWLWILFVLVGIGAIGVNWTTGQFSFKVATINLLGAGAVAAGPHAPWFISVGIPVGAIMFWVKRRGYLRLATTKHEGEYLAEGSVEPEADRPNTTEPREYRSVRPEQGMNGPET